MVTTRLQYAADKMALDRTPIKKSSNENPDRNGSEANSNAIEPDKSFSPDELRNNHNVQRLKLTNSQFLTQDSFHYGTQESTHEPEDDEDLIDENSEVPQKD